MDTGLALSLKTVSGQVGVKGVVSAFFDGSVTVVSFFFRPLEYIEFTVHSLLGWYTFRLQLLLFAA